MPTVAEVATYLESFAPCSLAADWDNVGLLLGDAAAEVRALLTCLTVTPEVVAEAVEEGAQLVVTHHPILFRGAKRLGSDSPDGRLLGPFMRAGVAVYSPHTAFDNTVGGINDIIAGKLGLTEVMPLRRAEAPRQCKVVVFVPDADLHKVSDALFAAGAGVIGEYRECSYRLAGTGTFFGTDATNPTVGTKGRREEVSEWRLEVICPEGILGGVLAAMRQAHSYEEPAYDVYPLKPLPSRAGEGRIGRLASPVTLAELARRAKAELRASGVQMVGEGDKPVERVAVACGAAGEFLDDAIRAKAGAFLTGEMRFHDYLRARDAGVGLILPGHYATERPGIEELADRLQARWPDARVWASRRETDPAAWV